MPTKLVHNNEMWTKYLQIFQEKQQRQEATWNSQLKKGITRLKKLLTQQCTFSLGILIIFLLLLPLVRLKRSGFLLFGSGSEYFGTILASFSAVHPSVLAPAISGDMEWPQTSRVRHGALHSSHRGNAAWYLGCRNNFEVKEVTKATLSS